MTGLAVFGWGAVSAAGIGADALVEALGAPSSTTAPGALVNFDAKALLGRKGTSFLDRRSALALVACGEAVRSGELTIDEQNRHRIGIVLGTTWGSLSSMSDYTRDTLVENPPYMVSAALFPNTVMNCAAGQAAIWYGLRGINATIAGGQTAFLNAARYAANMLRWNRADLLLLGAVEEHTPHTAWVANLLGRSGSVPAGEGAAVFLVGRSIDSEPASRAAAAAEIRSIVTGFCPASRGTEAIARALEKSIRCALRQAGIPPQDVFLVATGESDEQEFDDIETTALELVFPDGCERTCVKKVVGECFAATGAFQMAAVLAATPPLGELERNCALLTSWTPEGAVAAAVVRKGGDARSHNS